MSNNAHKVLITTGAPNKDRADNDLYVTPENAVKALINNEHFNYNIWECACGTGAISSVLADDYNVLSTDIEDYGYKGFDEHFDFLKDRKEWFGDIITNPPYKYALEFVQRALQSIENGHKVAMLLRIQFLEGQKRYEFFKDNPPYRVYVFSKRITCKKIDRLNEDINSAMCFCWFVWSKGFKGTPEIKWI